MGADWIKISMNALSCLLNTTIWRQLMLRIIGPFYSRMILSFSVGGGVLEMTLDVMKVVVENQCEERFTSFYSRLYSPFKFYHVKPHLITASSRYLVEYLLLDTECLSVKLICVWSWEFCGKRFLACVATLI